MAQSPRIVDVRMVRMAVHRFEMMTRQELTRLAPRAVAVLPLGATEQHGQHLPLGTDTLIGEAFVDRAAELLADGPPVVILPSLHVGSSEHHLTYGALSLPPVLYLQVLEALIDSVVASGFTRLLLVNSHGGNDSLMRAAVNDAVLRHRLLAAACSWWSLGDPRALDHAGPLETSLMLAAHPGLVGDHAGPLEGERPALFDHPPTPGVTIARTGEWRAVHGVSPGRSRATAQAGQELLQERSELLVEVIRALADIDPIPAGADPADGEQE